MMLQTILKSIFVYLPAALFWILTFIIVLANAGEKKNKELHEADGK